MFLSIFNSNEEKRFAATIIGVVLAFSIVLFIEYLYRTSGGMPNIIPGMTSTEYNWKMHHQSFEHSAVVVGDSRVGWGFSERKFSSTLGYEWRGVNAGLPGTSAEAIIRYILKVSKPNHPGILIINYSPSTFYYCSDVLVPGDSDISLQELLDEKLRISISQWLYTSHIKPNSIMNQITKGIKEPTITWVKRKVFYNGYINAILASNDGKPFAQDEYQLYYDRQIMEKIKSIEKQDAIEKRRAGIIEAIQEAKNQGWKVIMVRFPVGNRMFHVEEDIPLKLRPEVIANTLKISFIDYNEDPRTRMLRNATLDESHLTPKSADKLAVILAQDLRSRGIVAYA